MKIFGFIIMAFGFLQANNIKPEKDTFCFQKVWAYVMKGEEKWVNANQPVTDYAYFSAKINEVGRITTFPDISSISKKVNPKAKIHCVISTPYNRSLMYFCLSKDVDTRSELINDILRIATSFDGIQIDFESIRPEEGKAYLDFLQEIKNKLPKGKVFSVALPARVRKNSDAYNYEKISQIVDKVLIMAYDEHWTSGSPGTIASLNWCKRVCVFAKEMIPKEKLIMIMPLYGRVWQKQKISRALKYFQTLELWKEQNSLVKRNVDGSPFFEYQQTIDAVVHYEDVQSLKNKLEFYKNQSVNSVGFWRVSQEPAALWNYLKTVDIQ